uniref:Uncharacterized protein n=1 Tax=Chromera velia CCMP2878 TaxID=1169474 RepID=A0A0G4F7B9_9ALVE|eukprot:Cvel_15595.t1-p1 / transcript=Cvel_15595.t1 / gene=Cvel_15595 / organism=Chromera_velia_CCMP2878 / gene_product=hypothetical protein / transcript_product=hypothetical protein / location=Cvel_scaffold1160:13025-20577(-) / protein_length=2075 / sequence_SO=supercontig / SO=protein_coding / is_pseudo=false
MTGSVSLSSRPFQPSLLKRDPSDRASLWVSYDRSGRPTGGQEASPVQYRERPTVDADRSHFVLYGSAEGLRTTAGSGKHGDGDRRINALDPLRASGGALPLSPFVPPPSMTPGGAPSLSSQRSLLQVLRPQEEEADNISRSFLSREGTAGGKGDGTLQEIQQEEGESGVERKEGGLGVDAKWRDVEENLNALVGDAIKAVGSAKPFSLKSVEEADKFFDSSFRALCRQWKSCDALRPREETEEEGEMEGNGEGGGREFRFGEVVKICDDLAPLLDRARSSALVEVASGDARLKEQPAALPALLSLFFDLTPDSASCLLTFLREVHRVLCPRASSNSPPVSAMEQIMMKRHGEAEDSSSKMQARTFESPFLPNRAGVWTSRRVPGAVDRRRNEREKTAVSTLDAKVDPPSRSVGGSGVGCTKEDLERERERDRARWKGAEEEGDETGAALALYKELCDCLYVENHELKEQVALMERNGGAASITDGLKSPRRDRGRLEEERALGMAQQSFAQQEGGRVPGFQKMKAAPLSPSQQREMMDSGRMMMSTQIPFSDASPLTAKSVSQPAMTTAAALSGALGGQEDTPEAAEAVKAFLKGFRGASDFPSRPPGFQGVAGEVGEGGLARDGWLKGYAVLSSLPESLSDFVPVHISSAPYTAFSMQAMINSPTQNNAFRGQREPPRPVAVVSPSRHSPYSTTHLQQNHSEKWGSPNEWSPTQQRQSSILTAADPSDRAQETHTRPHFSPSRGAAFQSPSKIPPMLPPSPHHQKQAQEPQAPDAQLLTPSESPLPPPRPQTHAASRSSHGAGAGLGHLIVQAEEELTFSRSTEEEEKGKKEGREPSLTYSQKVSDTERPKDAASLPIPILEEEEEDEGRERDQQSDLKSPGQNFRIQSGKAAEPTQSHPEGEVPHTPLGPPLQTSILSEERQPLAVHEETQEKEAPPPVPSSSCTSGLLSSGVASSFRGSEQKQKRREGPSPDSKQPEATKSREEGTKEEEQKEQQRRGRSSLSLSSNPQQKSESQKEKKSIEEAVPQLNSRMTSSIEEKNSQTAVGNVQRKTVREVSDSFADVLPKEAPKQAGKQEETTLEGRQGGPSVPPEAPAEIEEGEECYSSSFSSEKKISVPTATLEEAEREKASSSSSVNPPGGLFLLAALEGKGPEGDNALSSAIPSEKDKTKGGRESSAQSPARPAAAPSSPVPLTRVIKVTGPPSEGKGRGAGTAGRGQEAAGTIVRSVPTANFGVPDALSASSASDSCSASSSSSSSPSSNGAREKKKEKEAAECDEVEEIEEEIEGEGTGSDSLTEDRVRNFTESACVTPDAPVAERKTLTLPAVSRGAEPPGSKHAGRSSDISSSSSSLGCLQRGGGSDSFEALESLEESLRDSSHPRKGEDVKKKPSCDSSLLVMEGEKEAVKEGDGDAEGEGMQDGGMKRKLKEEKGVESVTQKKEGEEEEEGSKVCEEMSKSGGKHRAEDSPQAKEEKGSEKDEEDKSSAEKGAEDDSAFLSASAASSATDSFELVTARSKTQQLTNKDPTDSMGSGTQKSSSNPTDSLSSSSVCPPLVKAPLRGEEHNEVLGNESQQEEKSEKSGEKREESENPVLLPDSPSIPKPEQERRPSRTRIVPTPPSAHPSYTLTDRSPSLLSPSVPQAVSAMPVHSDTPTPAPTTLGGSCALPSLGPPQLTPTPALQEPCQPSALSPSQLQNAQKRLLTSSNREGTMAECSLQTPTAAAAAGGLSLPSRRLLPDHPTQVSPLPSHLPDPLSPSSWNAAFQSRNQQLSKTAPFSVASRQPPADSHREVGIRRRMHGSETERDALRQTTPKGKSTERERTVSVSVGRDRDERSERRDSCSSSSRRQMLISRMSVRIPAPPSRGSKGYRRSHSVEGVLEEEEEIGHISHGRRGRNETDEEPQTILEVSVSSPSNRRKAVTRTNDGTRREGRSSRMGSQKEEGRGGVNVDLRLDCDGAHDGPHGLSSRQSFPDFALRSDSHPRASKMARNHSCELMPDFGGRDERGVFRVETDASKRWEQRVESHHLQKLSVTASGSSPNKQNRRTPGLRVVMDEVDCIVRLCDEAAARARSQ